MMDENSYNKHFRPGFLNAFAPGQHFHDYILRDFCGCGAYGEVWQAEDISGRRLAIKIVSKKMYGDGWQREFNGTKNYCQAISSHPNLIQVMHVGEDDKYFFYTMELADNLAEPGKSYYADTLADRIAARGPLSSEQLVVMTEHLLSGVGRLHQAGLIHRDIKPANIIFIDGIPKLSDIGFVTKLDGSMSMAGTVGFMPPEELLGKNESHSDINSKYDIYGHRPSHQATNGTLQR
jgi:serine/threonine protein kinase